MRFVIPKVAAMAEHRSRSITPATAVVRERGDSL
jgi:hypothetical protein